MKLANLLIVAAIAAAGTVQAQDPGADRQAARAAMMKACDADIKSMCADKQGREVMMCLRGNSDKVSTDCKDAMAKMPARPAAPPPQ